MSLGEPGGEGFPLFIRRPLKGRRDVIRALEKNEREVRWSISIENAFADAEVLCRSPLACWLCEDAMTEKGAN